MGGIFSSQRTEVQGPINFKMNQNVSFEKDGIRIYGTVIGVDCTKYETSTSDPNTCNLNVSNIWIKDQKKNTHLVRPNEPTLKIENMTVEEAIEKYKTGTKVSFLHKGNIVTGITNGFAIGVGTEHISKDDTVSIYVPKGEYSDSFHANISFTDPNLKLVDSDSGKQKYTLEDDNKYRIKYMKYKAKYLAQK